MLQLYYIRTNEGYLIASQTKKINSKWYAFNPNGVMLDGLVFIKGETSDGVVVANVKDAAYKEFGDNDGILASINEDNWSADDIYKLNFVDDGMLFYFSGDEEKDGSMKTGSAIKISLADNDYTFKFKKGSGAAVWGIDSKKLYDHGILQTAGDDSYELVELTNENGEGVRGEFLVNKSGTICKENKWYKDSNDYYWAVVQRVDKDYETADKDETLGYIIVKCDSKDEANEALGK